MKTCVIVIDSTSIYGKMTGDITGIKLEQAVCVCLSACFWVCLYVSVCVCVCVSVYPFRDLGLESVCLLLYVSMFLFSFSRKPSTSQDLYAAGDELRMLSPGRRISPANSKNVVLAKEANE